MSRTPRVADVLAAVERAYPLRLAEDWDTGIGLTCGDPDAPVDTVLLAVDVDPVTVAEARERGAQVLLTHHPLFFRPVQTVSAGTDKGSLVHQLVRSGIAHIAAHTNADRAIGGVNDALAAALELSDTRPLLPAEPGSGEGLGRIGRLAAPMSLADFTAFVAARLPATAWGVRAAGDPARSIETVAVCGGSGGSELAAAGSADVYVTSDITHHIAQEHIGDPSRPTLVDIAHWAGEWPWLGFAARMLAEEFGEGITTPISTRRTDAWSVHVPARSTDPAGSPSA